MIYGLFIGPGVKGGSEGVAKRFCYFCWSFVLSIMYLRYIILLLRLSLLETSCVRELVCYTCAYHGYGELGHTHTEVRFLKWPAKSNLIDLDWNTLYT